MALAVINFALQPRFYRRREIMMLITVKLFATFRKNRFKEKDMELAEGASVEWVIDFLKIPRKELGVVFINGLSASPESVLKDGDTLSIFPMVGGG